MDRRPHPAIGIQVSGRLPARLYIEVERCDLTGAQSHHHVLPRDRPYSREVLRAGSERFDDLPEERRTVRCPDGTGHT
jgi:hypothetical protein